MSRSAKLKVLSAIKSHGPNIIIFDIYDVLRKGRVLGFLRFSFARVFNIVMGLRDAGLVSDTDGPLFKGKPLRAYSLTEAGEQMLKESAA